MTDSENLSYYKRNKASFDRRRRRKVECSQCGKLIQVSSVGYHKKSALCAKLAKIKKLEDSGSYEVV